MIFKCSAPLCDKNGFSREVNFFDQVTKASGSLKLSVKSVEHVWYPSRFLSVSEKRKKVAWKSKLVGQKVP